MSYRQLRINPIERVIGSLLICPNAGHTFPSEDGHHASPPRRERAVAIKMSLDKQID